MSIAPCVIISKKTVFHLKGIALGDKEFGFMSKCVSIVCLLCFISASNAFSAQEVSRNNSGRAATAGWSAFTRAGFVQQMDTDIDGGGSFSVNRFFIQTGPNYSSGEGYSFSLAVGYGFDSYDFSGKTAFGSRQPWDDVHSFSFSIPWRWEVNENWLCLISPTLRYSATNGVELNDAITGGGLTAFSYRYSDRLSIGAGLGMLTQLEDNTQIIPILTIRWKITDNLSLQSGQGMGAIRGPGLTLVWQPRETWSFSFGSRYEVLRFRIHDSGSVSNGVGEDRSFPVLAGIEYRLNPKALISLTVGVEVGGELSLADREGRKLIEEKHDTAGFLGISFSARF